MVCGAKAAQPILTGVWGGPQIIVTLGETGGNVQFSCASAGIDSPVRPDLKGKFSIVAQQSEFGTGPTPADRALATFPTRFAGHVDGDILHLAIERRGAEPAHYTLKRDRRVKLIRCM